MATLDNKTFRELNGEAEVFPGKANYWVIVVHAPGLLALPEVERLEEANDLVERFLSDFGIDGEEARALDVWPASGIPKGRRYGLVQPQPMTYPKDTVFISLTWDAPKDAETKLPWPWQMQFLEWSDVNQGLVAIYQPGSIVDVPSALDNFVWALSQTATDVKEDAKDAAKKAGEFLEPVLYVGAAVVALLVIREIKR
jgi:hypothetical protein